MTTIPEHVLHGYRQTLANFVARARRVESHSLLSDRAQFIRWACGSGTLTMGPDAQMQMDVPPEEAFESLVARVRPLLLESDGIHHKRVLAALRAFVRADEELMRLQITCRKAWENATGSTMVAFGTGLAEDGAPLYTDVDMAQGWLYGDLVHAAPNVPAAVMTLSLNQRYLAAVIVYGQAALATLATLDVIKVAVDRGLVAVDGAAFQQPVVVSIPWVMPLHAMRITDAAEFTMPTTASAPPGDVSN